MQKIRVDMGPALNKSLISVTLRLMYTEEEGLSSAK